MWTIGDNVDEIFVNIKKNVEILQDLLAATGGGLNLQKCAWTVINAPTTIPHEIKIKRTSHDVRLIKKAIETLHQNTTFKNLHTVSRLSGVPPPKTMNQEDIKKFITTASDDVQLKYISPTTTQKSLGFYFNIDNP